MDSSYSTARERHQTFAITRSVAGRTEFAALLPADHGRALLLCSTRQLCATLRGVKPRIRFLHNLIRSNLSIGVSKPIR